MYNCRGSKYGKDTLPYLYKKLKEELAQISSDAMTTTDKMILGIVTESSFANE